jgi:hypothetical protein
MNSAGALLEEQSTTDLFINGSNPEAVFLVMCDLSMNEQ